MTTTLTYLNRAIDGLRDLGLVPESTEEAPIVALLDRISDLDETKVVAIARTLNQASLFNEVVREQISGMSLANRYEDITGSFNSIRDDARTMVDQLEDGKIDTFEKIANVWMKVTRGDIQSRFEKIKSTYTTLDSVPQKGFYRSSGLEFDNFDLLHREGETVAMSRWMFNRETGKMSIEPWKAFARLNTGGGAAMVPQGTWSYAPRHQPRTKTFTPLRSLVVFRDKTLFGCLQDKKTLFRRDFDLEKGEKFETKWITGWSAGKASREGKMPWRTHRLAEKAAWKTEAFTEQGIVGMVLAGDRVFLAGTKGEIQIRSAEDGALLEKQSLNAPLWDGMAVADGKLFVSTRDGKLFCFGEK